MSQASAVLGLRARILWKRHATPFDALLVLGTLLLAALAGRQLHVEAEARAALALAALAATAVLGALPAHRLLYRSKELALVLAQPVSARGLVIARLVELTLGAILACALVAAVLGGSTRVHSLGAPLAVLAAAPLVASVQLLLAWVARRLAGRSAGRRRALAAAALALLGTGVGWALVFQEEARALVPVLARQALPGEAFRSVLESLDLVGLAALAAWSVAGAALALAVVPLSHQDGVDAAAAKPAGRPWLAFSLFSALAAPLPRASAALVRRDLTLLARGGFPRGLLVLLAVPAGLVVFQGVADDRRIESWEGELAALLTCGVFATLGSFLFSLDFPRSRAHGLALERAQPVSGRAVHLARWFEGALPGLLL
ncbi:hypothetical protein HY251_05010, partial [bacterium]|nr:hypothetical protein [bacterium]